jgi:hypothetical protein
MIRNLVTTADPRTVAVRVARLRAWVVLRGDRILDAEVLAVLPTRDQVDAFLSSSAKLSPQK